MSWSGVSDFEQYLTKARADAEAEAMRAIHMSADELVDRVKRSIKRGPDKNGHIADSVHKYMEDEKTVSVKIGGDAVPYAAALEFGHHEGFGPGKKGRVPPQKVFFPNVRIINKRHGRRIRRWFRKAIKDSGAV